MNKHTAISLLATILILVSAFFGIQLLVKRVNLNSQADSTIASLETELGTRIRSITQRSDTTASGGSYIEFGSPTSPTNTPAPITGIRHIASTNAKSAKGVTSITVSRPAGIQAGDILLATMQSDYGEMPRESAGSIPTGWNLVNNDTDGQNSDLSTRAYWKVATNSEPSSYTWPIFNAQTIAIAGGTISIFRGVDTVNPIFAWAANPESSGQFEQTCPSVNSPAAGMLVCFFSHDDPPRINVTTNNTGLTEISYFQIPVDPNYGFDDSHETSYQLRPSSGQTGAKTAYLENSSKDGNDHTIAIVLRPSGSTPLPTVTPGTTIIPTSGPTATPAPPPAAGFVTKQPGRLMVNGQEFKFAGANMSWLAMRTDGGYTTDAEIDDALNTAVEMGIKVIRSHTLGVSVGCSRCIKPSKNQINNQAFRSIDYAIKRAGELGIYLIIPFSDQAGGGGYYSGGNRIFASWEGVSTDAFYTNDAVIQNYKDYVSLIIDHVNQFTGTPNWDNPWILAWETGNEMRSAPCSWTREASAFIKSKDSRHLVLDGNDFFKDSPTNCNDQSYLSIGTVDIFQTHHYPLSTANMISHANLAANNGKAFIEGENGIVDGTGAGALTTMYGIVEGNNKVSGSLFWQFFGHADVRGYLAGNSAFTLHYPGESADTRQKTADFRTHAYRLRGQSVPASRVTASPVLHTINSNQISWRGVPAADGYRIERSTNGTTWTQIGTVAHDGQVPWTDSTTQSGTLYYYRVRAVNRDGVAGAYSNVQQYQR